MKKLSAILLLSLLLFNLVGYRFFFSCLENNAQAKMCATIDSRQFKSSDLFEIKVPLHMPYFNSTQSFERYDGSVEVGGVFYNYVERKISNDTLVLLCTPNAEQNKIHKEKVEYANVNSSPQNTAGSKTGTALFNLLVSEFNDQSIAYHFAPEDIIIKPLRAFNDNASCSAFLTSPEQPPEII